MATKGQSWKQNRNITPEQFVKVFTEKDSFEEVAEALNISVSSVKNRAYSLKRCGVNLTTKRKNSSFFGASPINEKQIEALNKIIDKANK